MSLDTMFATLGTATVARLLGAWVAVSLKGSVLIVVAWIVTRAIRRGSAAVRHAIWTSALAGMLVLPILAGVLPRIELVGLPDIQLPRANAVGHVAPVSAAAPVAPSVDRAPRSVAANNPASVAPMRELETAVASTAPSHQGLDAWLPFVLILGAALLLVRAIAGVFQLSIWTRRASAVYDVGWLSLAQRLAHGMGISRPVTLLRSDRACVPMTWGVVYPRVLLPAEADAWTPDRRTIVLLHELAHVKRLDAFTQFVAQISVVVFWFNPIVWFAARQMRIEREHACDDFVLDAGARASDYANDLLQIARSLVTSGAPAAAALAMARRTELEGRLLAILNPRLNRRSVSWKRLAASSLGVFALAFPLAALQPARELKTDVVLKNTDAILKNTDVILSEAKDRFRAKAVELPRGKAIPRRSAPQDDSPGRDDAPGPVPPAVPLQSMPSTPALTITPSAPTGVQLDRLRQAPGKTPPDVETLIAVARAAKKLTSDYEKGELLVTLAKYYVRDDELRTAYLDAVASMTSDYERTRTLAPLLLKDSLPMKAVAQVVKIASMMSSDNDKASLIVRIVREHPTLTQSIRAALIAIATTMRSDYDRGRSIAAIARRGGLSNAEVIDLINAVKPMIDGYAKANALVLIASQEALHDADVRRAYLSAAETISSASDYRRAIVRVLE